MKCSLLHKEEGIQTSAMCGVISVVLSKYMV